MTDLQKVKTAFPEFSVHEYDDGDTRKGFYASQFLSKLGYMNDGDKPIVAHTIPDHCSDDELAEMRANMDRFLSKLRPLQ